MENKSYVEVKIRVNKEITEGLANLLIEQGCGGLVIEESGRRHSLELRVYLRNSAEANSLVGKVSRYLKCLKELNLNVGEEKIGVRQIRKQDWEKFWKRDIKPIGIGEKIVVQPTWVREEYPDKIVINIDPKMAFGTGRHETTRLCITQMERLIKREHRVLDVGTGSGILAILAAKLGASYVLAIDPDRIAIDSARENIEKNKVQDVVELRVGTMDERTPSNYFDVVVANLFSSKIFELFERIKQTTKDNGIIILSGILDSERDEVSDFLKKKKMSIEQIIQDGGWLCYVAK